MASTKEFYSEEQRLKSFFEVKWPLPNLKPQHLAKCGFFYLGNGDRVQCPFCGIVIFNWQSGDQPIFEHKIHSGKCPFINGRDVGNIFIDEDPRELYNLCESEDVCGFEHISPPGQEASKNKKVEPVVDPVIVPVDEGVIPFNAPQSIEFITYDSRLATFNDWPIPEVIGPAKLAESGFFYKGPVIDSRNQHYVDFVSCFHCGIALCQWVKGDDPWQEHKKFNPDCFFLNLVNCQGFATTETSLSQSLSTESEPQDEPIQSSPPSEPEPLDESVQSSSSSSLEPEPEQEKSIQSSSPGSEPEPQDKSIQSSSSSSLEPEPEPEPQEKSLQSSSSSSPEPQSEPEPQEKSLQPSSSPSPQDESTQSSPESKSESESEAEKITTASSSKPKPFIPFTWLPKPKSEELTCKVCLDLQVGATFYPCLHASCAVCTSSISICPICRTKIESVTKLDTELSKKNISFYV